ncbi:MAG TPA: alkaline phosphatase D family protein [Novosphingobium sp.]|nr:alkaline phosphatase D family protein [Novosphingobium sp.]
MTGTISRRGALAGMAGGAALASLPGEALAGQEPVSRLFRHGVASGDPAVDSVVLWTRASLEKAGPVEWELADNPGFAGTVRRGTFQTGPERDFTVKPVVDGLTPGGTWYYRFRADGEMSETGRARTLPAGHVESLGIALVSCSNFAFGFFNAYDAIASDAEVDFVLHTGDYIYEYGADGWGGDVARRLGRVHEPHHEIVSLADYRRRHAQYKADADSRAMHAAHTLMSCWDDHESTNNPWVGGAQNHQPETEGDWAARREASIRAYYEWMPVREPGPGRSRAQFWRGYSFGDLATLFTLETRHTARAEQIDYAGWDKRIASQADADALLRETVGAPGRAMLAGELEADLESALAASVRGGQPWRLIGNPMPIARTRVPDVVRLGLVADPASAADLSDDARVLAFKGKWNLPFYPDTWDGYEWARERLYGLSRRAGAGDLIFLTGDSHSFWANRLADGTGRAAGVELGTAGVTSPGDFITSGFGADVSVRLDRAFEAHNPEVVWTDNMHQGYVRLNLRHDGARTAFVAVDTVTSRAYRTRVLRRFGLVRRKGQVAFVPLAG